MKILVTGYKDFNGHNPTQDIVDALEGKQFYGVEIVTTKLDVVWSKAWQQISAAVTENKPNAIVSFGVWSGIDGIKLETTAHNTKSPDYPDADGKKESGAIVEGGPSKLVTTIPYNFILKERANIYREEEVQVLSDVPASTLLQFETNDNAGGYLCNFAMYNNIYQYCSKDIPIRGFVHIRDTKDLYGRTGNVSIDCLKQSGAFVIKAIARWMTESAANRHDDDLVASRGLSLPRN